METDVDVVKFKQLLVDEYLLQIASSPYIKVVRFDIDNVLIIP